MSVFSNQKRREKKECYCYDKLENDRVQCLACSHKCLILPSKSGICEVRKNINGTLYSEVYDKIIALHVDPIEKKPLYHFLPGSKTFSIGTVGCNFNCVFCQNYDISFPGEKTRITGEPFSPKEIIALALKHECESIAYTYTEPTIFLELIVDTSRLAKKKGLKNILVTNGYLSKESINLLSDTIDAVNVDLKSFSEGFYHKNCKARLVPVLETIRELKKRNIWIEITTLLIEGENNSDEELRNLAKFIVTINPGIPWHISRFFPMHKMKNIPPTSIDSLKKAYELGKEEGIYHVYIGNTGVEQDTFCPDCAKTLISREIYEVDITGLKNNKCKTCGRLLEGIFK